VSRTGDLDPTHLQPQYSGTYRFNGGAVDRAGEAAPADFAEPVLGPLPPLAAVDAEVLRQLREPQFTLHVDVDGTDPLGVVSATVHPSALVPDRSAHFVGRVTADTPAPMHRDLVVEDFTLPWESVTVDRVEVALARPGPFDTPEADVTFVATAAGRRFGPYHVRQESPWFREVEVEVDIEDGAVAAEPFDTHLHPRRPTGLLREDLTLEKAFARSGIHITRSPNSNTIDTSHAGRNQRWSYPELHDAMQAHWSAFANRPQWKMWLFMAELADDDALGGVMFDGDIDEPGGVDRQGTALFTTSPFFHTAGGDYPLANPPSAEAARRELFFDLVHETGHAFNLAHSFDKQAVLLDPGAGGWPAPAWMPLTANPRSLSWMNYPDRASAGGSLSAEWFYDRFGFRFDDGENLFLRHAPARFVQMGNEAWFHNHGRAGRGSVDGRLQLVVRTLTDVFEYGEAVVVELRLRNVSGGPVAALTDLDPAKGTVEIAVTSPSGVRRPFVPFYRACARTQLEVLQPQDSRYLSVNLSMGMFGFPFTEPGTYRVEACYVNRDSSTAPASMAVTVREPRSDEQRRAADVLFTAPVGRVLAVGGSRTIDEVNETLDRVTTDLGPENPVSHYLTAARTMPLARPHKTLPADADAVEVIAPEPDVVERKLAPLVRQPTDVADALGHIGYRQVVDTYTDAAVEAGKRGRARAAQKGMLELFEGRNVVEPVVEEVRVRVSELA
jgi:hypothetical protein